MCNAGKMILGFSGVVLPLTAPLHQELRLEGNMTVTRLALDLRLVHCEDRSEDIFLRANIFFL